MLFGAKWFLSRIKGTSNHFVLVPLFAVCWPANKGYRMPSSGLPFGQSTASAPARGTRTPGPKSPGVLVPRLCRPELLEVEPSSTRLGR